MGQAVREVVEQVIARAISLVEETRPLLPGVREAVALCKEQGLLVGLASRVTAAYAGKSIDHV